MLLFSECVLYYDESSLFCLFYVGYASLHDDIFLILRIKKYAKKASSDFYKIDMVP